MITTRRSTVDHQANQEIPSLPPGDPTCHRRRYVPSRHNGIKHAPRSILPRTTRPDEQTSSTRARAAEVAWAVGLAGVSFHRLGLSSNQNQRRQVGTDGPRLLLFLTWPGGQLGAMRRTPRGGKREMNQADLATQSSWGSSFERIGVWLMEAGGLHVLLESPCSHSHSHSRGKKGGTERDGGSES